MQVLNCYYTACMNPTAGSFNITPRMQRHFATFAVQMPGAEIVRAIYDGNIEARLKLTCTRTLYLLNWRGQEIMLIYSTKRREIITFLPPDDPKRAVLEAVRNRPH